MADANVSEPWRKNFACRPYEDDPEDVERFIKELPSALDDYDADKEYTCGQVLVGDHEGGNGPNATPFHGNAAAQRSQLRKCEKRQRKVAAKLKYHCLTESTKAALGTQCGHVIMRGNSAICWASRKLKAIALSSTEAEMCAGVAAAKDIIFLRNVLTFMGAKPSGPTPLIVDNEGMWFNVRNAGVPARTRHWEMWQLFVRKAYMNKKLTIHKTPTQTEVADILTKPLPKEGASVFRTFANKMLGI